MSSHYSYFTVISIVCPLILFNFLVSFFRLYVFFHSLSLSSQEKFFLSPLFAAQTRRTGARHWCLGDWVVFFCFYFFSWGAGGGYVFFMMWYTARERERWVRTYQCQATFSVWYEDKNDMWKSGPLLPFCQHLRLLSQHSGLVYILKSLLQNLLRTNLVHLCLFYFRGWC